MMGTPSTYEFEHYSLMYSFKNINIPSNVDFCTTPEDLHYIVRLCKQLGRYIFDTMSNQVN